MEFSQLSVAVHILVRIKRPAMLGSGVFCSSKTTVTSVSQLSVAVKFSASGIASHSTVIS